MIAQLAPATQDFSPLLPAQPIVRIFSPVDNLPPVLADMSRETLFAHVDAAKRLIDAHKQTARNGEPAAEHYYFFIPEVAADMANARYTISIMFAEIDRRETVNA